jgi:formylglycine-generating enzyme required for sulfatase activity
MTHNLLTHLDQDRQRAVENVRQAAARLWERPAHRHAINHGPAHAGRVVGLLGGLSEGLMKRGEGALAAEEIYVLLAAAHLHAIGLQDEASEADPAARLARYPELGAEMVYRALEEPGGASDLGLVDDPGLIEMIALVVAGHRETAYPSPDYDDLGVGGGTVRPRLLTALLHLADDLDLDCRRVDLERLKLMNVSPESALDWWLHHYVSGVQVRDEYVSVSYRTPRGAESYAAVLPELVERRARAGFETLRSTLRPYGVKVDLAPSTVRPMRAVKPMPPRVWEAAERRLAQLRGVEVEAPALSPLVETVRGLLATMGYDCDPPPRPEPVEGRPELVEGLTCFRCRPRGGGLRSPLLVGCKAGPAEVGDVGALAAQLDPDEGGYVIAEVRVLPSALDEAARSGGRVQVLTLSGFYHELLDFRAYVEALVDDYEGSELARYYVDLGCVRYSYDEGGQVVGQDRYKPLDGYVDAWLKERGAGGERNHISVLGDYGTGKTSFCRQYAAKQGRRWLNDPDRERIPVLINLRDYAKTLKVSSLVTEALVNQYGIQGATFEAFARYNGDGKLLLFFDGFDEMAQRTGRRTAVDNFWELARVVVPGSKVVLTCRTPYFRTHHEARVLLRGDASPFLECGDTSLPLERDAPSPPLGGRAKRPAGTEGGIEGEYIDLRDRPNFEIVHLEPFTDEDVQDVLRARFPGRWEAYWEQIQRIYNLPDLARRPVLLDMMAQTLPELKEGQTINAARLYRVYTDRWLERDLKKGRLLLAPTDRRLFAEELAIEMLHSDELAIHYSRIPARVRDHFGLEKAQEIDYFEADIRTCNFMDRDEAGNYAFAHKSFMEFFAASRLHRLMLEDRATAGGPLRIGEAVRIFLGDLFALEPKPEPGPPHEPPEGFAWVPPGEFVLGGEYGFDLQIVRLDEGFFAARTPVTNAQYARFVAETGHRSPRHWKGPRPPQRLADHPVVYVSWHDAVAYAEWAGARLPTEQEWEKAARGYDGREYPWGGWVEGRCNSAEAGIRDTTPVGQFSPQLHPELVEGGDSVYGLQDAAGNVWEWTASKWAAGIDRRVLRGGAFGGFEGYSRCSSRFRYVPDFRDVDYGFRVVAAPSPPSPRSGPSALGHSGKSALRRERSERPG